VSVRPELASNPPFYHRLYLIVRTNQSDIRVVVDAVKDAVVDSLGLSTRDVDVQTGSYVNAVPGRIGSERFPPLPGRPR
jgi:hypothetical protein